MIAALSVPEHCLSFYFVCDDSNFLCCVITQNGESSRDFLLSVTNRKALALEGDGGGGVPPRHPHFKRLITLLPVTFSQLDSQLGCWLGEKVSTLIGYLLTDGLNCLTQIFSRLAFAMKGRSSKTCFISSVFRLLCIALWHYVREQIIYTIYSDCVLVLAIAFLS